MERMSGMDASFVYTETPTMHMHVVGVLVLVPPRPDAPITRQAILDELGRRIHHMPPLRRRMVPVPAGIDHPLWIEDPQFDLSDHVRGASLAPPVSWAALEDFVGQVASSPVDRRRPLWEMWVVDGLEDGTTALVTKIHHAIMDGGAGGDLMTALFDLEPDAPAREADEPSWSADTVPSPPALVARSLLSALGRQRKVPAAAVTTSRNLARTAWTWANLRRSGRATPFFAPRSVINGALSARRSVALTRVELDAVRHVGHVFGTTVNDVVLAATGTALRGYLSRRGGVPGQPLVAAVPVNVRSGTPGADMGNHLSNMMVPLDLGPDDPVERLRRTNRAASAAKDLQAAVGPQLLHELAEVSPPVLLVGASQLYSRLGMVRLHPPVLNLIVSNVPGPPVELYCAGAKVAGIFPMGPLIEGIGLNLTVLSEARHLNVGIMTCPDVVGDADALAAGFVAAVADLEARAVRHERGASRRRARPTTGAPAGGGNSGAFGSYG